MQNIVCYEPYTGSVLLNIATAMIFESPSQAKSPWLWLVTCWLDSVTWLVQSPQVAMAVKRALPHVILSFA